MTTTDFNALDFLKIIIKEEFQNSNSVNNKNNTFLENDDSNVYFDDDIDDDIDDDLDDDLDDDDLDDDLDDDDLDDDLNNTETLPHDDSITSEEDEILLDESSNFFF
jgi:hypothetical protein